ncbi:hypothetical protein [Rhodanobacter sp. L36]|uniref:hypothetical protein n=1 Tax=Rhodanobacter sp. L36 TaxID=1747221 RepID=UPI00131BFA33|nr:hypothetical protein [Rhodanobacter sp. L36]
MNWKIKSLLFALLLWHFALISGCTHPVEFSVPLKVSLCDILQNPGAYDDRLIEVSGNVTRGFESFTLSNGCNIKSAHVWLELGGKTGSQVIYCCGAPVDLARKEALTVDDIVTTLVQDAKFQEFQKQTLVKTGYSHARATLIGRFFSGKKRTYPGGTYWVGYGHMGFFSLLAIQQVVAVSKL